MSFNALLTSVATYWEPASNDGFGGLSFGSSAEILVRYQQDSTNFQDTDGSEWVSAGVVYSSEQLVHDGYIYLGSSAEANPLEQEGAYRIRRLYTTQNPNGSIIIYKAVLG